MTNKERCEAQMAYITDKELLEEQIGRASSRERVFGLV